MTDASKRIVFARESNADNKKSRHFFCAEPSPDVAQALTTSVSAQISALTKAIPAGANPEIAASIAHSTAQSVAQLGERLATIQLLRDGLYRACEAYASGALNEVSYAVLLSRYDDTMVTMLSTEMAAGAFGRSLATLGGNAGSKASGSLQSNQFQSEHTEAVDHLKRNLTTHSNTEARYNRKLIQQGQLETQLQATLAQPPAEGQAEQVAELERQINTAKTEMESLKTELAQSRRRVSDSETRLNSVLKTFSSSSARAEAEAAGSITPGQQSKEVAEVIEEIQKNYVENINADALEVACVTALSKPTNGMNGSPTPLAHLCHYLLLESPNFKKHILTTVFGYKTRKLKESTNKEIALSVNAAVKARHDARKAEQEAKKSKHDLDRTKYEALKEQCKAQQKKCDPKSSSPCDALAVCPSLEPDGGKLDSNPSLLLSLVQAFLNKTQNARLRDDGVMDEPTGIALKSFQHKNGLQTTGIPDEATIRKIKEIDAKPKVAAPAQAAQTENNKK